jgi:predicted nucleic-acid-binding protein
LGRAEVKITVDTNVLVRAVVGDDKKQAQAAAKLLKESSLIAVSLPCLCEFVWVLRRVYKFGDRDVAAAIETLVDAANVVVNRQAVDAGLAVLNAGGDFADGLIAHEGNWLGGETFVSFDKKAVAVIAKQGQQTRLLS